MIKSPHYLYVLLFTFVMTISLAQAVYAQQDASNFPAVEGTEGTYYYDDLTMDKLSKLYWKLQKFEFSDNQAIDTYLMINECEIYKEYHYNELEWRGIRQNAKVFLQDNIQDFPDRYKFTQPLRLEEYDIEKQVFNIQNKYKINGIRKFEVFTNDYSSETCVGQETGRILNYPAVLLVELTQPINLTSISMTAEQANDYINDKMRYVDGHAPERRTKELIQSYRDAYIVMKVKMMSYKGTENIENRVARGIVYALLEGYEVYADREHTKLIAFENYLRGDETAKGEAQLKSQYEALRKKRGLPAEEDSEEANENATPEKANSKASPDSESPATPAPAAPAKQSTVYDELNSLQ